MYKYTTATNIASLCDWASLCAQALSKQCRQACNIGSKGFQEILNPGGM
jgi:hypothetical protein